MKSKAHKISLPEAPPGPQVHTQANLLLSRVPDVDVAMTHQGPQEVCPSARDQSNLTNLGGPEGTETSAVGIEDCAALPPPEEKEIGNPRHDKEEVKKTDRLTPTSRENDWGLWLLLIFGAVLTITLICLQPFPTASQGNHVPPGSTSNEPQISASRKEQTQTFAAQRSSEVPGNAPRNVAVEIPSSSARPSSTSPDTSRLNAFGGAMLPDLIKPQGLVDPFASAELKSSNQPSAGKSVTIRRLKVINVSKGDTLSLRSEANAQSRRLTRIPWDATDVLLREGAPVQNGIDFWFPVSWRGIEGWVNGSYVDYH